MSFLTKLRIGPRLGLAFGSMIVLIVVMVATALLLQRRLADRTEDFTGNLVPSYDTIHETVRKIDEVRQLEWRHFASTSPATMDEAERQLAEADKAALAGLTRYAEVNISDDTDRANTARVQAAYRAWRAQWPQIQPLSRLAAHDPQAEEKAQAMMTASQASFVATQQAMTTWFNYMAKLSQASGQQAGQTLQTAQVALLASALVALGLAVAAAWLITRSIVQPTQGLVQQLERVARGDLTVQAQTDRHDEVGDLQRALGSTVKALQAVVGDVRAGVDSVTTASNQIAAGNLDLSSRTEQQASSLQQTASSMEELTGALQQSAAHAQQASDLAGTASQVAGRGGESVERVVQTMADISDSSRRISDITGVIDGIAFQTNILALNAAVEAARAGEQGRGFAVVAGEVRTLAQRSAEAAREIKSLIHRSVEKIEAGGVQVATAGQAMTDIVQQVNNVTTLMREIALAAREQGVGIASVNDAITQMDQVTQQNAALVEESAAAAGSLAQQAQRLSSAVAVFRLPTASLR